MNAKKLLSTLLSAAMAVSMLAGCFGGGGNKNYSDEAVDAANAAQSTVVFATDTTLAKSLQDALADGLTQLDEIDDAMEADENLKPLLTSGWDLDIFAAQGEDAEAAAKTIAEQYIVSAVIGKKAEGKIAMVLHDGNGYYYVAVLTYGNGGSGSGGGTGGGSGSGEGGQGGGTTPGTDPDDPDKPGPDDDENNSGGGDDDVTYYSVTTNARGGNGHYSTPSHVEEGQELSFTVTADKGYEAVVTATMGGESIVLFVNGNRYTYGPVTADIVIDITFAKKAPEQFILNMGVNDVDGGNVYADIDGDGTEEDFLGDTFVTAGEDFTFTVIPNDNYEIEKVTATRNGESRELSEKNGTYTVEDIQSDVKVLVTFAEKAPTQYIVHVSQDGNGGTVRCLGDSFVNAGDDFSFTVELNDKYHKVESITVKRGDSAAEEISFEAFAESESYTVENINSDVVVTVTFAERDVIDLDVEGINESYKVGESITADEVTVTAKYEGDVEKTLTPEEYEININLPYTFTEDDLDGVDVTVSYGGKEWSKDVTVEQNQYTVTVVSDHSAAQDGNVTAGDDFTFTVTDIEAGYEVTGATVTAGSDKAGTPKVKGNTITVPNVQGDITVTVQFAKKQYDVTINIVNPSFGTVEDTINTKTLNNGDTITVEHGGKVNLQITPKTGYRIAGVTTATGHSGSYTLENITDPATITVTFEKIPVVTGIEIVDGSFKDEYTCYDKLDLNGMQIKVTYDNGETKPITITNNSQVGIKHVDQTTGWWDDGVKNQYEGGQWVGGIILGYQKGGHWVAKFNITYKDFTDSIEVNVICGDNSDRTYDCRYCPNWDGMSNIARSTRSAKAHFSTESKG